MTTPATRARYYHANKHIWKEHFQKNKQEIYAKKKAAHDADPSVRWATNLRIKWGWSESDFHAQLSAQGGVCAICKGVEKSIDPRTHAVRRLAIDHCHTTNVIRGLLCSHCNRALGLLKDSADLLIEAAAYLRKNK